MNSKSHQVNVENAVSTADTAPCIFRGSALMYADPILRLLRKNEYTVQKDIADVMPYYNSYVRVLAKMQEEGLVSIEKTTEGRREIRYALTSKGERIADVFEAIYKKIVPKQ